MISRLSKVHDNTGPDPCFVPYQRQQPPCPRCNGPYYEMHSGNFGWSIYISYELTFISSILLENQVWSSTFDQRVPQRVRATVTIETKMVLSGCALLGLNYESKQHLGFLVGFSFIMVSYQPTTSFTQSQNCKDA